MRIATWNVEWFDALFDDGGRLLHDAVPARRGAFTRAVQADAIAHVLRAVDPDLVLIVEAPDSNGRRSTTDALRYWRVS